MRALALAAAVLAVAAPAAFAAGHASAVTITVTAGKPSEYAFKLSGTSVPVGTVVFHVVNKGPSQHDFKIAGKKTPLLKKGKKATLKVILKKGKKYAYICSVPGHAQLGMKGTFKAT